MNQTIEHVREVTAKQYASEQGCSEQTAHKRLKAMGLQIRQRTKKTVVFGGGKDRHTIKTPYYVYLMPEGQS